MTSCENSLALCIIKENLGDLAKSVASLLITKKSYPLLSIANELNVDKKLVSISFSRIKARDHECMEISYHFD